MNGNPTHIYKHRQIAILAFEDCEILDVCGPLDVFAGTDGWLGRIGRTSAPAYSWSLLAPWAGPVVTASGTRLVADRRFDEAGDGIDTLLIAGGEGVERALGNTSLMDWLNRMGRQVRRIAAISTGAFLLAGSGVLDGHRATTHWACCARLADSYPNIRVETDRLWVRDGSVYTSGGAFAGIDLALALIEEDWGKDIAVLVSHGRRPYEYRATA
jgi:transcriptional regulator GlxA family with amidase domain